MISKELGFCFDGSAYFQKLFIRQSNTTEVDSIGLPSHRIICKHLNRKCFSNSSRIKEYKVNPHGIFVVNLFRFYHLHIDFILDFV